MAIAPVNQLDGSAGANENCVPASIIDCGRDLVGDAYWNNLSPQQLRQECEAAGYEGPTAARDYLRDTAAHHLSLTAFQGTQQQLVDKLHAWVGSGAGDALVTIPSQWNSAYPEVALRNPSFSTHVCAAMFTINGGMQLYNPWGGFKQNVSDAWLLSRLCYGEIWLAAKEQTTMAGQATGYLDLSETSDPNVWQCTNGFTVGHGFRDLYASLHGAQGQGGTQILGLPLGDEYKGADGKIYQDYERAQLCYDANAAQPWQIVFSSINQTRIEQEKQLEQLQQQQTDPKAQVALAAIEQLKTALGAA